MIDSLINNIVTSKKVSSCSKKKFIIISYLRQQENKREHKQGKQFGLYGLTQRIFCLKF